MPVKKQRSAKASILIVEDEVIVAIELREKLRALGWRVSGLATSGAEAIAAAEADPPDLVLMDITIKGGMDGFETARRLQAGRRVPVIFITAFIKKPAPRRASPSRPPLFWLSKPLVDEELVRTIRTALAGARIEAAPPALRPRSRRASPEKARRERD
jgi:CheY-like chemotaxis protein